MKRYFSRFIVIAVATVAVGSLGAILPPSAHAVWAAVARVSEGTGGVEANAGSTSPSLSWDGQLVAFASAASNLVPGDTNGASDIFLHNRLTGTTTRVSVASDGTQANKGSTAPAISGDGRFVAFTSDADNLVADDTNGYSDVFVHDMSTGITERVSTTTAGDNGNLPSGSPSISWNGRFVAFYSLASNLVAGDSNSWWDVFVKDRQNGYTQRVSVASDGSEGNNMSYEPAITFDGRYVTFTSIATNLVPGDTNGVDDIFIRDRITNSTERVSLSATGTETDAGSFRSSVSYDGRLVAYESLASNVVLGDSNGSWDVFVRDRSSMTNERVSVANDGSEAMGNSRGRALSWDGRRVAFTSAGTTLVAGDTNLVVDSFVRDRIDSATWRVSVSWPVQVSANTDEVVLAGGGRSAAFTTAGEFAGLLPDGNGVDDVYVADSGESALTETPSPDSLPELTPGPPPAPPTDLAATTVSDSQVNLLWTDNSSDEMIFKIERRSGAGSFEQIADVGANVTSYSDTGLAAETTYTYRVRAANPDARSNYTNEATATTFPATPPDAPSNLTATAVTGTQVDISWVDNSVIETGFKIERRSGANPHIEVATVPEDTTSYSDFGLEPMTTYWYRVRATNFAGDSGYSNEASATTLPDFPPYAPQVLQVLTTTADQAHLRWSDNSGNETGFEIQRRMKGGAFAMVGSTDANTVTFVDRNLLPATTYEYRVRAINSGGASGYSNIASGTTRPAPVCKLPQLVFASNRSGNYEIYVANEDGSGVRRVTDTLANETRPVFAPGADKIVFVSDESGNPDIFSMNLDGSNRTRLTTSPGVDANPVVRDGVIAFDSDRTGISQIWMMNLDGTAQTQVTSRPEGASNPAFSPAPGRVLAFQGFVGAISSLQIFTMEYGLAPFSGSTPFRMNPSDNSMQGQPTFSPDGSVIAYISNVEDGQFDLYTYSTSSNFRQRLTFDSAIEARPWFASDGSRVYAVSDASGNFDISLFGAGQPVSIAASSANDVDPSTAAASPWAVAPYSNFLAEGATSGGFETWILMSNPNPARSVTACITYLTAGGIARGPIIEIPPLSRRSERVGATIQSFDVSTVVEGVDGPVLAERALYSARPDTAGSHVGRASRAPGYTWYSAEGATAGGFETWVLIANPSRTNTAQVSVNFLTSSGVIPGPQGVEIGPGVRRSYRVSDFAPGQFNVASEVVSAGSAILVERASYVNTLDKKGATNSPAVNAPRKRWHLAEGASAGNFETWILVSNPQSNPATVDIKYLTSMGQRQGPRETIPARSRRSYNVAHSGLNSYDVSTEVSATAGVVVERAMYVNDPLLGRGASTGEGVPSPANDWIAVEGAASGGFTTWILIANPNQDPACVEVVYLRGDGPWWHSPNPVCLPPRSRRSLRVNDQVVTYDVSTRVTSTTGVDPTNGVSASIVRPVLVERSVYTPAGASQDSTAGPAIKPS